MSDEANLARLIVDPASWIRDKLQAQGRTMSDLADHLGRERSLFGRMLNGKVRMHASDLPRIANFFGYEMPEVSGSPHKVQVGRPPRRKEEVIDAADTSADPHKDPQGWVRQQLERSGRTQADLATFMGWEYTRVSKIIHRRLRVQPQDLPRLHEFFGLSDDGALAAVGKAVPVRTVNLSLPSGTVTLSCPANMTSAETKMLRSWLDLHLAADTEGNS